MAEPHYLSPANPLLTGSGAALVVLGLLDFLARLPSEHLHAQDFTRFAFGNHFKWPAADLTIGRKSLCRGARIHHQIEALAAIWALDGFADFHTDWISPIGPS